MIGHVMLSCSYSGSQCSQVKYKYACTTLQHCYGRQWHCNLVPVTFILVHSTSKFQYLEYFSKHVLQFSTHTLLSSRSGTCSQSRVDQDKSVELHRTMFRQSDITDAQLNELYSAFQYMTVYTSKHCVSCSCIYITPCLTTPLVRLITIYFCLCHSTLLLDTSY